ncbi:MAG: ferritin [Deltaproteobacteria bacterium]|nr:ferritin [Deltaproteobacteria bacterium]
MLKDDVERELNVQIGEETASAWLYLSMAAWFESMNLPGFANWMFVQAQEELVHARMFYDFVHERRGRVILGAIAAPPTEWASPLEAFEAAFAHEVHITERIHFLTGLADRVADYPTRVFLHWFVTEQVEEEASADEIVQKLRMLGETGSGLFMLDRELGTRVFTPPAAPAT